MRHKIVIEEAHRIFPAIHPSKMDSPAGGAVKVISELLKEVRASDVSVDICDQSPGAVYRDAILNTAIKLAFRTADGADKREFSKIV
jgi:DNA helicase HerA-like ATPase